MKGLPKSRCIGLSVHHPSKTKIGIQRSVNWMLRSMGRPCDIRVGSKRVGASGMTRPSKNWSSELPPFSRSPGCRSVPLHFKFWGLRGLMATLAVFLAPGVGAIKADWNFSHWDVENLYMAIMPSEEKDMTGRITSPKNLSNKGAQRNREIESGRKAYSVWTSRVCRTPSMLETS